MPIVVETYRSRIRSVVDRWWRAYGWQKWDATDKREKGERLRALDLDTCSAEQVNAIIGNQTWTSAHCDNCGTWTSETTVTIGQEPDYESGTATVCVPCLLEAAEKAKGEA